MEENRTLNIEKALSEIDEILKQLESGEQDLETSLKLYEKGTILIAGCQERLNAAEVFIEELESNKAQ